jgi:hypothetical protein
MNRIVVNAVFEASKQFLVPYQLSEDETVFTAVKKWLCLLTPLARSRWDIVGRNFLRTKKR